MKRVLMLLPLAFLLFGGMASAQSGDQAIDIIRVGGTIDPPTSDYLLDRLDAAQEEGVHAVVIQLDTPGAVDVSTTRILDRITNATVPIVVWIAPRGARAAGAGTFIAYSSDLAFMAEDTELGPATPLNLAHESSGDEAAETLLRQLGESQGHDPSWATEAVTDDSVLSSTRAAERGAVNGVASSLGDLLRAMDGQKVLVSAGHFAGAVTLETWDEDESVPSVSVRFQEPDLLQRLLHAVTTPDVAYLLLLIGMFGIIFEIYNPGIGLAAIIGAVALLLGFYALSVLPTNWLGVLVIVGAVGALVIDMHTGGLGAFSVSGIVALIAGALILFTGGTLEVSLGAILAGVIGSIVFFISVMTAALRVRLRRPITGEEGIVGAIAEAKTDIAPEGTVITKGTLWRARTMETGIAAGERVRVKATEGLVLLVEPLHGDTDTN